ncbi:MAG: hydroxymethylbilane synthase [Alphaproteobacteria bacterium]|nr:hydroxymethylbilane synthase [Alphaproteobacteria bacterium]
MKNIRLGTRSSPLALRQASIVKNLLIQSTELTEDSINIIPITTSGDKYVNTKISDLGIKGVFTKELEIALLEDQIDIAVHSLKDMPAEIHPQLRISSYLKRDDVRDILIGFDKGIESLPAGTKIGTSSLRREAQIKKHSQNLHVVPIRGNIGTRISKIGNEVDVIILAKAGLDRMSFNPDCYHIFGTDQMLPAAAQGIIAIETKLGSQAESFVKVLNDNDTMLAAECERAFLKGWEEVKFHYTGEHSSSCRIPLAALSQINNHTIHIKAMVEDQGELFFENDVDNIENRNQLGHRVALKLGKIIFEK